MYWMDFLSFDDTWCFWRGVFILPKTRCVSRNFTFNSLAKQVECDWGDGSPLFTGQLDKMTPEIVSCLWKACTMCRYLNLLLLFRWTQIWNTQLSTSMCWMENTISRASKYQVEAVSFLIWWVISPTQGWPTWFRRCGLAWRRQLSGMTRYLSMYDKVSWI